MWRPPSCLTAKKHLDNTAGTAGKRFSELGQALAKNTTRLLSAWLRLASGLLTTRAPGRLELRPLFCAGNSPACLLGLLRYCCAHAPATAYGTAGTDMVYTETVMGTDTETATLCWKPGVRRLAAARPVMDTMVLGLLMNNLLRNIGL